MKKRVLTVAAAILVACSATSRAQTKYILHTPPGQAKAAISRNGLQFVRTLDIKNGTLALASDPSSRPADQVLKSVRLDPSVQNAELNALATLPELDQSTVGILDGLTDRSTVVYYGGAAWSQYVSQPAASIINVASAHDTFATGAGVVAVIDTGVDPTHPALAGSLLSGYDFVNNVPSGSELVDVSPDVRSALAASSSSLTDKVVAQVNQSTVAILDQSTVGILDGSAPAAFGHGTMVSGLVHLAAPSAKIMPLKAFSADGTGQLFNIISAIYFAVDNGAKSINMSFSMDSPSTELASAISYAKSNRVVSVASVGNSGAAVTTYPAGFNQVVGTASTSNNDARSSFSNYGAVVDVAAPGEALITTYPGKNYAAAWGTSFSTALVTGGAALLRQVDSNIGQDQATTSLEQAVPVGPGLGAGRIDLYQACQYWTAQKGR